jgi:peptide deformylase
VAIRPVIRFGHPILRKKAKPADPKNPQIVKLALDMIETLREEGGIGLAAQQVNVPVSLMVLDLSTPKASVDPVVLLNPKIMETGPNTWDYEEGCLSFPEIRHTIQRPSVITVEAFSLDGRAVVLEKAQGILARVLQHEIDHLNGVLFVDHMSPEQIAELQAALKKLERKTKRSLAK